MKFHLELDTIQNEQGRKYIVENKLYDSATTVVGFYSKDSIKKWRETVGEKEADRISLESSTRGTELHSLCEDFFLNNLKEPKESLREDSLSMFQSLVPYLKKIESVYSIESCLYSHSLEIAGRTDLLGVYEGIPSVVDFKTTRKQKRREWIDHYFAQLTMYSHMFKERTGESLNQLVILMVSVYGEVQVFKEPLNQIMYDNMYKYIDFYRNANGYKSRD